MRVSFLAGHLVCTAGLDPEAVSPQGPAKAITVEVRVTGGLLQSAHTGGQTSLLLQGWHSFLSMAKAEIKQPLTQLLNHVAFIP